MAAADSNGLPVTVLIASASLRLIWDKARLAALVLKPHVKLACFHKTGMCR